MDDNIFIKRIDRNGNIVTIEFDTFSSIKTIRMIKCCKRDGDFILKVKASITPFYNSSKSIKVFLENEHQNIYWIDCKGECREILGRPTMRSKEGRSV